MRRESEQARDKSTIHAENTPGATGADGARRPQTGDGDQEHERISRALRLCISTVMLECSLGYTTVAFVRDGFAERAQNDQHVLVGSPTAAPTLGVKVIILSEEGWKVWVVVVEVGSKPGTGTVWTGLLGVR